MAIRTLKVKYETDDDSAGHIRRVFCASKGRKETYYQFEDEPEATSEPDAPTKAADITPAPVAVPPPTPTASPAASIEDVPIHTVDILANRLSKAEELPQ